MRCLLILLAIFATMAPAHAQQSTYYAVPKGDFPHDVAVGPGGEVWYSGQAAALPADSIRQQARSSEFRWARTPRRMA